MIRRTALITAASIAGVVIAGGAAVGANIGVLNAADSSSLGNLSAETPITTSSIGTASSLQPIADDSAASDSAQSFAVDVAGTVDVETSDAGLVLVDVRTNQGWSWVNTGIDNGEVVVTFTSGTDTLEFAAMQNLDGTISASVDRPVVTTAAAPTQATGSSTAYRDDDGDDGDDDRYERDDDHEYEGGDDDD